MFCKYCGKSINDTAHYCRYCGKRISERTGSVIKKYCPFCKTKLSNNERECPNCNRVLTEIISDGGKRDVNNQPEWSPVREFFDKLIVKVKGVNFRKFISIRYFLALIVFLIIVLSIITASDSSYNGNISGTRTSLPAPTHRVPNNLNNTTFTTDIVLLANGTILKKNSIYFYGHGELTIKNGANTDAVAKLIRDGGSVFTVYIKAHNTYTITKIADGTYWLAFTQGSGWDSGIRRFQYGAQYSVFDDVFNFLTTEDDKYYHYTTFEITLNPVVGGNAETNTVDPTQFNLY